MDEWDIEYEALKARRRARYKPHPRPKKDPVKAKAHRLKYKREWQKKHRAAGKDREYNQRRDKERKLWSDLRSGNLSWWP